jgi:hypothetical protein
MIMLTAVEHVSRILQLNIACQMTINTSTKQTTIEQYDYSFSQLENGLIQCQYAHRSHTIKFIIFYILKYLFIRSRTRLCQIDP